MSKKAPAKKAEATDAPVPAKTKAAARPGAKAAAKASAKTAAKPASADPQTEETVSPEDTKIREYFKNPNVTFTGVYRTKVLEWIAMYEKLGPTNTIWREPKKVWKDSAHPAYADWSRFVEGFSNYDVQQLMNAAYENQQNAMLEMLACWFAIKLSGLSTDQMIREIQQ